MTVKTYEAIIKGENIPEPGIPESFKVLLKELQSLGLDVRVLREDNTEVEIMETVDMGETDFRSLIEGDRKYRQEENLGAQTSISPKRCPPNCALPPNGCCVTSE